MYWLYLYKPEKSHYISLVEKMLLTPKLIVLILYQSLNTLNGFLGRFDNILMRITHYMDQTTDISYNYNEVFALVCRLFYSLSKFQIH